MAVSLRGKVHNFASTHIPPPEITVQREDDGFSRFLDEMTGKKKQAGKPADEKETLELAARAKAGDMEARDTLVFRNMPLVIHVAKAFRHRGVEFGDLVSQGVLGLIKGITSYTPGSASFGWYIALQIRYAIAKSLSRKRLDTVSLEETMENHDGESGIILGVDEKTLDSENRFLGGMDDRNRVREIVEFVNGLPIRPFYKEVFFASYGLDDGSMEMSGSGRLAGRFGVTPNRIRQIRGDVERRVVRKFGRQKPD